MNEQRRMHAGKGFVYFVAHSPEIQREAGPLCMMNLGPSAVSLLDEVGDQVIVRDFGNSRDLVYRVAKRCGLEVSVRKCTVLLDRRQQDALAVTCIKIDESEREKRRRVFAEYANPDH